MANSRLDEALAALAEVGRGGSEARRAILDRLSAYLLQYPALGGQIVARLCAVDAPSPKDDDLLDLLGAGLDAARIARENGKARGGAFLEATEDALDLARRQDRMTSAHSLLFAQVWTRTALTAPAALEVQRADITPIPSVHGAGQAEGDAILEGLFADLTRQADGDPLALHTALAESFPAMPAEMRDHVVAFSVARSGLVHADLACFWLLDPAADIRLAAARGLAGRVARGDLPGGVVATLVVLRSWMPEDAARQEVDLLLKEALRNGVTQESAPQPWTVHSLCSSLPDGSGAQSIGVALQQGSHRKMAMLLLKQGQGVRDAYTIPCRNSRDQKEIMGRMAAEVGALSVTPAYVQRALSIALADGLAQGRPPVPGLIEVAQLCGFTGLRPAPKSTADLIGGLASTPLVLALPARQRGALILASEGWWDRHDVIESWFEDSDEAHATLDKARTARSAETALWKWLETRRDWWARILARAADVLETTGDPDAASFVANALALLDGRDLKKLPVMLDVHEQTIEAWIRDDPGFDAGASLEELAHEAPLPEKKGEVLALLRGTVLAPDWLDGYLTGVVIAPKMLMPNLWLPAILDVVLPRIDPSRFQRFMDLVMMRAQAVSDLAGEPDAFVAAMNGRSKKGRADWAAGFAEALEQFRTAWPKKGLAENDRRLLAIAADRLIDNRIPELAALISHRQARNAG